MDVRKLAAEKLAKFAVLFTAAVYVLALPLYYFLIAAPGGTADALLPIEATICLAVAGVLFAWSAKFVWDLIAQIKPAA